jgi:YgiT-type zinc finger domain-containing protein
MLYKREFMICEFCGGQTAKKKVKRQHWLHKKLYIVENVEAEVCAECGERYFHAKILDEIDHLLESRHLVKEKLEVEVVSL